MLTVGGYAPGLLWPDDLGLASLRPAYSTALGALYHADAIELLSRLPSDSVDLVMTSPPFALRHKKEYGNEPAERYIEWFMPFCLEIKRILKPTGSFVLHIGGSWLPGVPVRSIYHFELAVKLAKEFCLAQEFYWHNPGRIPTVGWVTVRRMRVKDAVDMLWWFSKTEWPKADNRRVLRPYSKAMTQKLLTGRIGAGRRPSGHVASTWFQRDNGGAIPPNLIQISHSQSNTAYLRECRKRGITPHPARYPEALVRFFLDFLTDRGDLVLDPFAGSNTTGAVCEEKGRRWLGTEIELRYIEGSLIRFETGPLFSAAAKRVQETASER